MLKKVLATALFGASVLGVATANASAPGVYVTGQLGYAKTHIKDKLTPAYQGLGNNNGLAGRLAIGYQLNQNFSVELGYLCLSSKKADLAGISKIQDYSLETGSKLKTTLAQNAIDLAAKGIVAISNNFNVYGKLGIAYLTTDISGKAKAEKTGGTEYNPTQFNVNDEAGIKKRQWAAPEAAIGVSYDITPNVALDTSWAHIHSIGKNRASNINFASVGISYNFG